QVYLSSCLLLAHRRSHTTHRYVLLIPHSLSHLFFSILPQTPTYTLFPYTTLFRSTGSRAGWRWPRSRRRGRPGTRRSAPSPSRSDRKSTRLNSSHVSISYAVFCLKKKKHAQTSSNTT